MIYRPKKISVLMPVYNEEEYIRQAIDDILSQQVGAQIELLVIDGNSMDSTSDIVSKIAEIDPRVKLLHNPHRTVPYALNAGIAAAEGEYIARVDAHASYPSNYLATLLQEMDRSDCDNVGCVIGTVPGGNSMDARSVAVCLASRFGVGNSAFRVGVNEPVFVDTVPFGFYKRHVFDRIGGFDVDLDRNQDDELNSRLLANGGRILLLPKPVITYVARDSYRKLSKMYYQYGLFKPLALVKSGHRPTMRQLVPSVFLIALLLGGIGAIFSNVATLGLLLLILLYVSGASLTWREAVKDRRLPCSAASWGCVLRSLFCMHISYGIGYLKGTFLLLAGRSPTGHVSVNR
ncbi:glycosyltransferase family 2 protein [Permianibacter sp. IMCC34836]|uniref:glycosyltransferase family 2 protein n=1 Tax=Permianibacter fluminis TaxID=2738515 RepID=UPI00155746D5|nr:glycosyltransferase family 2 protein [Permianibacter fluminis]NQD37411.1 glycosyltransferase family 2 protein [Permianibacter fluminis]